MTYKNIVVHFLDGRCTFFKEAHIYFLKGVFVTIVEGNNTISYKMDDIRDISAETPGVRHTFAAYRFDEKNGTHTVEYDDRIKIFTSQEAAFDFIRSLGC